MRLSPELQRYSKIEGLEPGWLASEIKRRSNKKEKNTSRREALVNGIFTATEKSVQGFFKGITTIRTHTPSLVKLFPWEEWYIKNYEPETTDDDPTKTTLWKQYKKEGVDAKHMYIVYLQDHYVVPQHLLHNFADQSTSPETRNSWLNLNRDIQTVLGEWVDRNYPSAIAGGLAKGMLSVIPQQPEDATVLLGGGAAITHFYSHAKSRREDVSNHLGRMVGEFSSLLQVHYRTHERSLAHYRGVPFGDIDQVSERIFTGSRLAIESSTIRTEAKAIAAGVAVAQALNLASADSLPSFATKLLGPAVAATYLYQKIRKERSGESVEKYIAEQTALLDEAQEIKRMIASERTGTLSLDLYGQTDLPRKRQALVDTVQRSRARTAIPLETAPWYLAFGTLAVNLSEQTPAVGSLITGSIIVSALSPFEDEFTRQRMAEVSRREIAHLGDMANSINISDYATPTIIDRMDILKRLHLQEISDPNQVEYALRYHPVVIHKIDRGGDMRKTANVEEPITLEPGISFIEAPSGIGKSELLRMIALEQGIIAGLHITKGIDLRQISYDILPDFVTLVETVSHDSEKTIAEQMRQFVTDPSENEFKKKLRELQFSAGNFLHKRAREAILTKYGSHAIRNVLSRLFTDHPHRDSLLDLWIEDPTVDNGTVVGMVNTVLNAAFMEVVQPLFPNINSPEEAAKYLNRKPGPTKGTSTGEAQRWELCKAMMKEHAILLLDEPTGNLDDNHYGDSSFHGVVTSLKDYMKRYPDTVIVVATNDQRLRQHFDSQTTSGFDGRRRRYVDKIIEAGGERKHVVWKARPSDYTEKE